MWKVKVKGCEGKKGLGEMIAMQIFVKVGTRGKILGKVGARGKTGKRKWADRWKAAAVEEEMKGKILNISNTRIVIVVFLTHSSLDLPMFDTNL